MKYSLLIFTALAAWLLSACSGQGDSPPEPPCEVVITFAMAPMGMDGDGHPGETEEDGSGRDNTIYDGQFFHVYIHDAATNELIEHYRRSDAPGGNIWVTYDAATGYNVRLISHNLRRGRPYRISVMVNLGTDGDLYETSGSFYNSTSSPTLLQNPHYLPMSGFRTFTIDENAAAGSTMNLGKLWLLRAVAKIEVSVDPTETSHWQIISATLPDCGTNLLSMVYPSVSATAAAAAGSTEALSLEQMFNPCFQYCMNDPAGADIPLRLTDAATSAYSIYLPEQPNPLPWMDTELTVALKMKRIETGQVIDAKIRFRAYSGGEVAGEPFNITRNHIYRFTVKAVKPLFDVDFEVIEPDRKTINVPSFD